MLLSVQKEKKSSSEARFYARQIGYISSHPKKKIPGKKKKKKEALAPTQSIENKLPGWNFGSLLAACVTALLFKGIRK